MYYTGAMEPRPTEKPMLTDLPHATLSPEAMAALRLVLGELEAKADTLGVSLSVTVAVDVERVRGVRVGDPLSYLHFTGAIRPADPDMADIEESGDRYTANTSDGGALVSFESEPEAPQD